MRAKAELQKISDDISEPDEDVWLGSADGDQGESTKGSGSQLGGSKVQDHLKGTEMIRGCMQVDR